MKQLVVLLEWHKRVVDISWRNSVDYKAKIMDIMEDVQNFNSLTDIFFWF